MNVSHYLQDVPRRCPADGDIQNGRGYCPLHGVSFNGDRNWCPVVRLQQLRYAKKFREIARRPRDKWWSATMLRQWLFRRERERLIRAAETLELIAGR